MPLVVAKHASREFNEAMHAVLARMSAEVSESLGRNMLALLLTGGYGLGEGGVFRAQGCESLYDPLALTVVLDKHRAGRTERALDPVSEGYEELMGVPVEFTLLTLKEVERWKPALDHFDLLNGHQTLMGKPDLLRRAAPPSLWQPLPLSEATRLLLTGGARILWAKRVVLGTEPAPDDRFLKHQYYRALLALGSAVLIAHERYETACRGREKRLVKLAHEQPAVEELNLLGAYRDAVRFRLAPDLAPDVTVDEDILTGVAERWGAVLLHIEALRAERIWPSVEDYVAWAKPREPQYNGPLQWGANLRGNLREKRFCLRHPREALHRRLPVLLGLTRTPVENWPLETADFLDAWRRHR